MTYRWRRGLAALREECFYFYFCFTILRVFRTCYFHLRVLKVTLGALKYHGIDSYNKIQPRLKAFRHRTLALVTIIRTNPADVTVYSQTCHFYTEKCCDELKTLSPSDVKRAEQLFSGSIFLFFLELRPHDSLEVQN